VSPSPASPHTGLNEIAYVCSETSSDLCLTDPGNQGVGGTVVSDTFAAITDQQFDPIKDTSRCGGGLVTATCPFNNQSLDSAYLNKQIVVLKEHVTQLCLRLPGAAPNGVMGACDTGSEPSTAFIFDVLCGGACNAYIGVAATNGVSTGSDDRAYLDAVDNNQQVFADFQTSPQHTNELWMCAEGNC
jgi:hypothetical protein